MNPNKVSIDMSPEYGSLESSIMQHESNSFVLVEKLECVGGVGI